MRGVGSRGHYGQRNHYHLGLLKLGKKNSDQGKVRWGKLNPQEGARRNPYRKDTVSRPMLSPPFFSGKLQLTGKMKHPFHLHQVLTLCPYRYDRGCQTLPLKSQIANIFGLETQTGSWSQPLNCMGPAHRGQSVKQ